MAFSPQNRKGTISGILFVAIFAAAATFIAGLGSGKGTWTFTSCYRYRHRYFLCQYFA